MTCVCFSWSAHFVQSLSIKWNHMRQQERLEKIAYISPQIALRLKLAHSFPLPQFSKVTHYNAVPVVKVHL